MGVVVGGDSWLLLGQAVLSSCIVTGSLRTHGDGRSVLGVGWGEGPGVQQ